VKGDAPQVNPLANGSRAIPLRQHIEHLTGEEGGASGVRHALILDRRDSDIGVPVIRDDGRSSGEQGHRHRPGQAAKGL
jgi:hypothetical protein